MAQKNNYIFTNKTHPKQGIMSIVLGIIAGASIILALYLTFLRREEALVSYGVAVLLAMIQSLVGFILGVYAKSKSDIFVITPYIGILLNGICLIGIGIIIYAGVYGL